MATEFSISRKEATIAITPFVLLGIADVVLLLWWGLDPLWGFMILPPILFISVLGWIAFRTGFARDRVGDGPDEASVDTPPTKTNATESSNAETTTETPVENDPAITEESAIEEELA